MPNSVTDFFEALDAALTEQREEKEQRPMYDNVRDLHQHVPSSENVVNDNDVVAVELCVVSVTPFSKGWHYELTNKVAAGPRFEEVKKKIAKLEGEKLEKRLFHLTVWQPPKRRRDEKTIPPGTLLFSDAITGFTLYKNKHQGEAVHASVMKVETPATAKEVLNSTPLSKKQKEA